MISILINNYNNGPWIRACVDSALAQTLAPDEIIIYDDGSADDSLTILESYGDRIHLIKGTHDHTLPGVQNQALAIHRALIASSGERLYLLDGDDCFLPDHLERYEAHWQNNPAFIMIHGSMEEIDSEGNRQGSLYRADRNQIDYRKAIYRYNETDYFYPTSSLAFRRDFLLSELPLDFSEGVQAAFDAKVSFAAVFSGAIGFVRQDTAQYRNRANSQSMSRGVRGMPRIEQNRLRAKTFNSLAHARGHPPVRLWLNPRYLLQLARLILPQWISSPFVKWKLARYRADAKSANSLVIPALNRSTPPRGRPSRIFFIVPGHHIGPDGITDYTFWVAAAAGRTGVECMIFAVFPFEDSRETYAARFPAAGPGRLTVRFASAGALSERLTQLESAAREFQPDWISLQFTPGTFRDGRFFLPGLWSLARILRRQIVPICLTAHETARVLISEKTWRDRALGWFRRFEIETGLKKLRPAKVLTSNQQHCKDLERAGFTPKLIPIISNIRPSVSPPAWPDSEVPVGVRVALIFGRISGDWDPFPVLAALVKETAEASGPMAVVSVGEVGHRDLGWQSVVKVAATVGLSTHRLGLLPSETISLWMQRSTCGISPTPFALWQKSSVCAAMLIHHLPIIFSDDIPGEGQLLPPRFATIRDGGLEWFDAPEARRAVPTTPDELWAKMALC